MTEEKKVFTVNDYYKEQSPKKRKKILESLLDQNDGEENQMRRDLFGLRYGGKNQRKDGDLADSYIGLWMNMKMLVNSSSGFFGNRSAKKELTRAINKLGIKKYTELGETARELLYREFYHMAALYITSSMSDRNYSSAFMGMISLKEEQLQGKLIQDVYQVAFVMPRQVKMENEFSLLTQAACDALGDILPDSREILQEKIKQLK